MKSLFFIAASLFFSTYTTACDDDTKQFFEIVSNKSFADVVQDAEFAITENNYRIVSRLRIGDAIRKRGNIGFPQNTVIIFCNLSVAEEMLTTEPRYINYCPYKITIAETKNSVIVGTHLLPENTSNQEIDNIAKTVNGMLRKMVKLAAMEDLLFSEEQSIK